MRRHAGFTLVELMVVVAILGILAASAMPLYKTIQQRAYGSEATLMCKQILDAQIIYFLEHDKFWPEDNETIFISHSTPSDHNDIQRIKEALKVTIPVGHFLEYTLESVNTPGQEQFGLTVQAAKYFPLFSDGVSPGIITRVLFKDGKIEDLSL